MALRKKLAILLVLGLAAVPSQATAGTRELVTFSSDGRTLYGCVSWPDGKGPFPAMIYNHGQNKKSRRCGPAQLAQAYVDKGYLFFAFQRSGHGRSPGPYIGDRIKAIEAEPGDRTEKEKEIVALYDAANHDVVAAVEWLKARPEVDQKRMVMSGVSMGGTQTLLTAEKGLGLQGFVAFAAAAASWENTALRDRLSAAVRQAQTPIFLIQAENDFSTGPSHALGPQIRAKGGANDAKLYPAYGVTQADGHAGFATRRGGIVIWEGDVSAFLDKVMH